MLKAEENFMAQINIEYFAILREHVGKNGEALQTNARTAQELFAELNVRYAFPELNHMKVAINEEFGDWNSELHDGDSIAFIPPVAGG